MKKLLLFTLFFIFVQTIKAQEPDPALFDQTWYLYEIYDSDFDETFSVAGYQPYAGSPEIAQISPYIEIDASLNYNGVAICNIFNGTLEYDSDAFRAISVTTTGSDCGFFENQDEPYVMGPFGFVDDDPLSYTIINPNITNDDDGFQTLNFVTQPFVRYTYRNTPVLSNRDFNKISFSISPNPTAEFLYITSEDNITIDTITVYNITGAKVSTITLLDNTLNIASLHTGVYFIEIASQLGKETYRVIKK